MAVAAECTDQEGTQMLHAPTKLRPCGAIWHNANTIYFTGHFIWSIAAQMSVQPMLAHTECQSGAQRPLV